MLNQVMRVISIPLILLQLVIIYFWIFNWEVLITSLGLVGWILSIVGGFIVYFLIKKKKITPISKILLGSTIFTALLAVLALLIEFATSSMP